MTISAESAATLAQIIPVGLLIIGIELRSLPKLVATGPAGTVGLWILGLYFAGGLVLGAAAEYVLLDNVLRSDEVSPVGTTVVRAGGFLVGFSTFLVLAFALADALGLIDRYGRRAMRRIKSDPGREARVNAYIEKQHGADEEL